MFREKDISAMSNSDLPNIGKYVGIDYDEWSDDEIEEMDTENDINELNLKKAAPDAFIDAKMEQGLSAKTIDQYKSRITEFVAYLKNNKQKHVCNVDDNDIKEFSYHLRNNDPITYNTDRKMGDAGIAKYLSSLATLYDWLKNEHVVGQNPAAREYSRQRATNEINPNNDDRPLKKLSEMKAFVQWLSTPFQRAWFLFLLKTGARRGGIVNADLRDLHIKHPLYQSLLDQYDIELVPEIADKPDSVYIMNDFNGGDIIRGEERWTGIKKGRKIGRVVPLDTELKTALLEYLLSRRVPIPSQPCHPIFVTSEDSANNSQRITQWTIITQVFEKLKEYNWYEAGSSVSEKVDNHYFRHYFTENHRSRRGDPNVDNMPDGLRAYIRGDADSSDEGERANTSRNSDYSHDSWMIWEDSVQNIYLNKIYKFDVYDSPIPAVGEYS